MSLCCDFDDLIRSICEGIDDLLQGPCLADQNGDGDTPAPIPEPGDIIGVYRGYQHYGIYAGEGRVIHYTTDTSDLDLDNALVGLMDRKGRHSTIPRVWYYPRLHQRLL